MTDNEVLERLKSNKAIELWHIPTKSMMYIVGIVIGEGDAPGYLLDRKSCFHFIRDFEREKPIPKTEGERILEMLTTELKLGQDLSRPLSSYGTGLSRAVVLVKGFIQKEK